MNPSTEIVMYYHCGLADILKRCGQLSLQIIIGRSVIKEDSINGTGILNKTTISLENEFEGVKQTIHDINVKDSTQTRSSF